MILCVYVCVCVCTCALLSMCVRVEGVCVFVCVMCVCVCIHVPSCKMGTSFWLEWTRLLAVSTSTVARDAVILPKPQWWHMGVLGLVSGICLAQASWSYRLGPDPYPFV